ncbi:uncharacterized protein BXZ73DRAFT_78058 [Epithele typhae]|uniref:uncharacterized protein n=1 Tax=Epithele typhae TaxID=378194 RepID=UPI00200878DD|nr:uncharacterized protein BXZ73DRAFT_78058 [Epithele typhae]KAH9929956.1 hypothetical protein BXZ73DRAFT_78058 [Epithele typhae]
MTHGNSKPFEFIVDLCKSFQQSPGGQRNGSVISGSDVSRGRIVRSGYGKLCKSDWAPRLFFSSSLLHCLTALAISLPLRLQPLMPCYFRTCLHPDSKCDAGLRRQYIEYSSPSHRFLHAYIHLHTAQRSAISEIRARVQENWPSLGLKVAHSNIGLADNLFDIPAAACAHHVVFTFTDRCAPLSSFTRVLIIETVTSRLADAPARGAPPRVPRACAGSPPSSGSSTSRGRSDGCPATSVRERHSSRTSPGMDVSGASRSSCNWVAPPRLEQARLTVPTRVHEGREQQIEGLHCRRVRAGGVGVDAYGDGMPHSEVLIARITDLRRAALCDYPTLHVYMSLCKSYFDQYKVSSWDLLYLMCERRSDGRRRTVPGNLGALDIGMASNDSEDIAMTCNPPTQLSIESTKIL